MQPPPRGLLAAAAAPKTSFPLFEAHEIAYSAKEADSGRPGESGRRTHSPEA